MSEEFALEIAKYILANWHAILAGIATAVASLVTGTWFLARHWYQREIQHCEAETASQEKLHDKEVRHLTRQLSDKDSYANGVIEVVSQRLLSAQEEPNRLLKLIHQHEAEISRLKQENDNLLLVSEKRKARGEHPHIQFKNMEIAFILDDLDKIADINIEIDPRDKHSIFISHEIKSFKSTSKEHLDLKAIAPIMLFLLKTQTKKMAELDLGLARCDSYLNKANEKYYESLLKIIAPLASGSTPTPKSDLNDLLKERFFTRTKHHLEWISSEPKTKSDDKNKD